MAALPPSGQDHLSNVPGDILKIIGEMTPDLLHQGQKTNKAIQKLLQREDIWNGIAQKLGIPIRNQFDAKRELTLEVVHVNQLLKNYLPGHIKSHEIFGTYAEFNAYIAAHIKEKTMLEAFAKLMMDFGNGQSGDVGLNAIKMFIKNGVLRNPEVPWEKYLKHALGRKCIPQASGADYFEAFIGDPNRYPEAFALILQEYVKTKPSNDERDMLFKKLMYTIFMQQNLPALENLIAAGLTVDQKMLEDFMHYVNLGDPSRWLTVELMLRSLLIGLKKDPKEVLVIVDACEKTTLAQHPHINADEYRKNFQFLREVITNQAILRQNKATTETANNWIKDTYGTWERTRLKMLARFCTPEDKTKLLALIETEEQKDLKRIADTINTNNTAAGVKKEQTGSREYFRQIKQIFK